MSFDLVSLAQSVQQLANRGYYIGTSSWKYEGWLNQLYTPAPYEYRGKVAMKRFELWLLTDDWATATAISRHLATTIHCGRFR
jgi:hypothetical protein